MGMRGVALGPSGRLDVAQPVHHVELVQPYALNWEIADHSLARSPEDQTGWLASFAAAIEQSVSSEKRQCTANGNRTNDHPGNSPQSSRQPESDGNGYRDSNQGSARKRRQHANDADRHQHDAELSPLRDEQRGNAY